MNIMDIYADYDARQRKDRIISAVLVGLFLLSTHVLAGIFGAYVWHLMKGC